MAWSERLVDALRTDFLYQHVAVFLLTGDTLMLAAQRWGAGEDVGQVVAGTWVVPFDGSVVGRVFATGSPSLVGDIRQDPDYRAFPGAMSRSELAVPILVEGRAVGVVNLESPRVGAYGIRDLDVVVGEVDAAAATFPREG